MNTWITRELDAPGPDQTWNAFPAEAIVQVYNAYGETWIATAGALWWGYETDETEPTGIHEAVIVRARRLDRPRGSK